MPAHSAAECSRIFFGRVGRADGHDVNILAVGKLIFRNADDPILVGHQVGEDDAGLHQEVEVGRIADWAGGAFAGCPSGGRRAGGAARLVVVFSAACGPLFAGVGIADRPRIQ